MDTQRFILVLALALVSIMLWEAWQQDYGSAPAGPGNGDVLAPEEDPGIPQIKPDDTATPALTPDEERQGTGSSVITVETDVLRLKIDQGGTLVSAELPDYPVALDKQDQPFVLLDNSADLYYVIQSGIVGVSAPTHTDTFISRQTSYALNEDEEVLEVPLTWESQDGISVSKVFVFTRGSYRVHLKHIIENNSGTAWEGRQYTQIKRDDPSRFWEVAQFSNADNNEAHYATTGPEIWEQTEGRVDLFVAAEGSGGSVCGVGRYLKERNPAVRVYTVEPTECPVLSGGSWGTHLIEGIGDGFIPDNLDLDYIDGVVTVSSEEAIAMSRRLAREEGVFCGISSGCNVVAANKLAAALPGVDLIVTIINDTGMRYFSTPLFGHEPPSDIPEREHPISDGDRRKLADHKLHVVR